MQNSKLSFPEPDLNVEALKVEELPPKPPKAKQKFEFVPGAYATPIYVPPNPPVAETRRAEATLATFRTLGYVLSARALLLVAVLGGFVLAVMAMLHETPASLYVLVAWCCLTIGPIVVLELRRRAE